jgi:hypothetical protein
VWQRLKQFLLKSLLLVDVERQFPCVQMETVAVVNSIFRLNQKIFEMFGEELRTLSKSGPATDEGSWLT